MFDYNYMDIMIFMFELFGGQVVYRSIVASATNSSLSRT